MVTGKLDVREAAASLPDEHEDAELIDAELDESFVADSKDEPVEAKA